MWRDRSEYTDLDGGTQQFIIGHRSSVIDKSSLAIRLGEGLSMAIGQ
jgi:hypothetical protein